MKKIFKTLYFIFFLMMLVIMQSCAKPQTQRIRFDGVNLENEVISEERVPNIKNEVPELAAFGPMPEVSSVEKKIITEPKKVYGLILGPGLYRSVAQLSLLRELDKRKFRINVISGKGFGAVIAALYAAGKTPEKIEWIFYKFFSMTKTIPILSNKWSHNLRSILIEELGHKSIQSTPLTFILGLYNNKEKKVDFFRKGDLVELLMMNLSFNEKGNAQYSSALGHFTDLPQQFKSLGVDKIWKVDVLNSSLSFKNYNENLFRGYQRELATQSSSTLQVDEQISLNLDDFELDTMRISDLIQSADTKSREIIPAILKKLDLLDKSH